MTSAIHSSTRALRTLGAVLVATAVIGVVLAAVSWTGSANAAGDPRSLGDELRRALEESAPKEHGSLEILSAEGVRYEGYSVAERLPRTGAYLVEMQVSRGDDLVRYPVKVERSDGRWTFDWSPRRAYAKALMAFVRGDAAQVPKQFVEPWAEDERLPALPLILREDTIASPFGVVRVGDSGGVEPPETLGKHVGRWVDTVLERDRGAAGLDLLVAPDTPWRNVTRALLAGASAGLFRTHFVVRPGEDSRLAAFSVLAPVFERGRTPNDASSFIVAIDSARPLEIRVDVGGELLAGRDECGSEVSICDGDAGTFAARLPKLVRSEFEGKAPSVSHVMVAAAGSVDFADVLPYAVRIPGALGIPVEKLFVGHIGKGGSSKSRGGSR